MLLPYKQLHMLPRSLVAIQSFSYHTAPPYIYHKPAPTLPTMASDNAYSAFLDKANQDTGVSTTSNKSSSLQFKTVDTEVPSVLESVDQYYISDADEPFEVVSLKWSGGNMPSEREFTSQLHEHDTANLQCFSCCIYDGNFLDLF